MTQAEAYGDYTRDDTVYSFTVDSLGLIDGSATGYLTIDQHIVTCRFDVTGYITGSVSTGHHMTLKNDAGATVKEWDTGAGPVTVQGITPGTYTLTEDGRDLQSVTVLLTSSVQDFSVRSLQVMDIVIVGAGFALLVGLIVLIIVIKRRKS